MTDDKIICLYPKFWEAPTQNNFENVLESLEFNKMSNKTIAIFIKCVVDVYPLVIPNKYKDLPLVKPRVLSCWDIVWGIRFNRSKKYIDEFFAAYLATGNDDFRCEACDISDIVRDPYGRELFNMLVE